MRRFCEKAALISYALVVGLGPYLDIELFGQQSYGPYRLQTLLGP